MEDAEYVIISYGSAARICIDAIRILRKEGIRAGLMRPVTVFPFPEKEISALKNKKGILCVEMAKPEQFACDVKLHLDRNIPFQTYVRCGGNLPDPEVAAEIVRKMA